MPQLGVCVRALYTSGAYRGQRQQIHDCLLVFLLGDLEGRAVALRATRR
jgi:hypothetical protein